MITQYPTDEAMNYFAALCYENGIICGMMKGSPVVTLATTEKACSLVGLSDSLTAFTDTITGHMCLMTHSLWETAEEVAKFLSQDPEFTCILT